MLLPICVRDAMPDIRVCVEMWQINLLWYRLFSFFAFILDGSPALAARVRECECRAVEWAVVSYRTTASYRLSAFVECSMSRCAFGCFVRAPVYEMFLFFLVRRSFVDRLFWALFHLNVISVKTESRIAPIESDKRWHCRLGSSEFVFIFIFLFPLMLTHTKDGRWAIECSIGWFTSCNRSARINQRGWWFPVESIQSMQSRARFSALTEFIKRFVYQFFFSFRFFFFYCLNIS